MLGRCGPWLAMVVGLLIFAAYALAAWHECQIEHIQPDFSGLNEAADKSLHFSNPIFILEALTLPLILFVYALPISVAIPICLVGPIWSDPDDIRRRAVRSVVGALLVGSIVAILSGMVNPRYGYVMLPLVCLLAGAVAACAARGELPKSARDWARGTLDVSAVGFLGLTVGVAIKSWKAAEPADQAMIVIAGIIAIAAVVIWLKRRKAIALISLLALVSFPLAVFFKQDRANRSAYPAAMVLAAKLPAGTLVTTGQISMNQPELFYYSRMRVESYPTRFATPLRLPASRWVILTREEYAAWSAAPGNVLSQVTELWPKRNNAYLA
jgi:hypothetical protein